MGSDGKIDHMSQSQIRVVDAVEQDIGGVTAIVNEVIATSTAIYSERPVTVEERVAWWKSRVAQGYPVLVVRDEAGVVAGFATFGDFRSFPGYRYTVEHSVHVRSDWRGRGLGSALVRELFPRALAVGKHVMIAGVDASNAGSIRMHERLGFEPAAELKEVGRKFGRWLDLLFMAKMLDVPGAVRPD